MRYNFDNLGISFAHVLLVYTNVYSHSCFPKSRIFKKVSHVKQGCIYFLQIIILHIFLNEMYSCHGYIFLQPLLQSSLSYDHSEII